MNRWLLYFFPGKDDHLSDDQMADLFCRELSWVDRWIARRHLAKCLYCSACQQDLEGLRAEKIFSLYRSRMEPVVLPEQPRAAFVFRLNRHFEQSTTPGSRSPHLSRPGFGVLATCTVLGLATIAAFFVWRQQRVPGITSSALLARAGKSETLGPATASDGVLFQSVRISTPRRTLERSIYRDLRGQRRVRRVHLSTEEEQIESTLTTAGLDWDEPLSASGYRGWHDRQTGSEDRIARAGDHLLKLTTKVAEGSVAEQSLTVRDTDFHPIRRTVSFRDSGTVEIAELDFKVLPWAAVDTNLFEPMGSLLKSVVSNSPHVLQLPRILEMPSVDQLEQAELTVRLLLNQLHADSGEQIEIHQLPQEIEVSGLVETDERKRTLLMQLSTVPHVKVSLQSLADLTHMPAPSESTANVITAPMPDQPSPLEIYLVAQGRSVSSVNRLAQALFNNALTIGQESKAIDELQTHFGSYPLKTVVAAATLSELIYSHHERLQASIKQQVILLAEARNRSVGESPIDVTDASSLRVAAARNLALCRELTQTNGSIKRSAETILAEISATMDDLTADSRITYGMSHGESSLSGKK